MIALVLAAMLAQTPYDGWRHSGSFYLLTTPDGADLPASVSVRDFPILVRLHKDFFPFDQAAKTGDDLRFTAGGKPLAYQIEEWDAANGQASVWVRIPKIDGNARQEIKMHWGNPSAASESSGKAVFNDVNGYAAVWHMTEPTTEDVHAVKTTNKGTTATTGVIGRARRFAPGQGIDCGDAITTLPAGATTHTSEAWVRVERSNGRIVAWGVEKGQGKVVMSIASPPHVRVDCYFSDGNVAGEGKLPMNEWIHVAHVYRKGEARVYVNGVLDGIAKSPGSSLSIPSPARLAIGGWYGAYNFVGDIDEVRVSNVARSAEWLKLQYENQKPMQTLVGPLVKPGSAFAVSKNEIVVDEGKQATVSADIGGAQKIYWILNDGPKSTVVTVDRSSFTLPASRVVGDKRLTLQLRAIVGGETKTKDIPVTIKEDVPEPAFTLIAPAKWNGRDTIEVVPQISNTTAMEAKGAGKLNYQWNVAGLATIKTILPDRLVLKRAQNSGTLRVQVRIDNGGSPVVQEASIDVTEPARDAWVERVAGKDEKPVDNQFYARDDKNKGTLHYNGTLPGDADSVSLRVTADGKPYAIETRKLPADRSYAFAIKLDPGLVKYAVEFSSKTGDRETLLHTAANLVCGDAYVIQGQSNADATDFGKDDPAFTSDWIRSFGSMSTSPDGSRLKLWANAVARDRKGGKAQIGYWGMELARRLVEQHKVPIFIINGAVGGTRIDQHQRNAANPEDPTTIYGRLLARVREAKLTHGVRGVIWHQGENDQGADGPSGGYGWETYRENFIDLAAAWKEDFPNVQNYYAFQIWPRSCAMGVGDSDNRLREVQRTLPQQFSNMRVMSTLGIKPPGGCHFPAAGYAEFARLMAPLIERDNYGVKLKTQVSPVNIVSAHYSKDDELVLEFDQPVTWNHAAVKQIFLDDVKGRVTSGAANGNRLVLTLTPATKVAERVTYLDGRTWNQDHILVGDNGIAALTFCDVPILRK